MSGRELSRFTMENDSNIPVLKKTYTGAKKSKTCSKLPGLQRYIETIIKASNEFEPENVSLPDKVPKGRYPVCKGLENKMKQDKLKFDVLSNKRKNKRQTSKKYSEAVSRGVDVLHEFFSEFEDPRNWKIRHSGSHLKIEKLIEKFYPNPYTIRFENECKSSETQIFFQKVKKDNLGDETSYDVFISKVDAETQDNLENNDSVSADFQIILAERENKSTNASLAFSFESLSRPEPKTNDEVLKSSSKSIKNTSNVRYSHSVSNVNSRVPSSENINEVSFKESQVNIRKNIINKKFTKNNSKEILPGANTPNDVNDYDLGKLKLLNLSDSESSTNSPIKQSEIKSTNNLATDDFVTEISSEICNEISKTNDLNDLLQIYEVMNKATESFLYLTSIKKPGVENGKSDDAPEVPNSENEDMGQENRTLEDISEEERNVETESEKLDNFEEEPGNSANESEETGGQKVEDNIFDANEKINEVLKFMNDCILKFNSEHLLQQEKKNGEEIKKDSSENILKDNESQKKQVALPTIQESSSDLTDKKSIDSSSQTNSEKYPEAVERTNKNQNARIRCKRKSKLLGSVEADNPSLVVPANGASTSNIDTQPEPNAESVTNNENIVQVAEIQNELGGYAEETQDLNTNNSRVVKSVFPLSTKVRRSQPETYKTLKDALEIEEKLLKLNKPRKLLACNSESQILIKSDPIAGYYPMGGIEGFHSGFVFCITPFSSNLTTAAAGAPTLSLPKPLSLSLIDFRSWGLKPLPQMKEHYAEKLPIPSETKHQVLKLMNSLKIETLWILRKKKIIYCSSCVGFPSVISFSKIQTENSIQYSKRQIRVKPLKKYSIVNLNTPGTSGLCIRNTVFTTSKSDLLNVTESLTNLTEKPVEALLKAIQETENVFLLQQQNNNKNNRLESFCSCGSKELLNNETVECEQEKENDKRKVQNLLLRTYRLQKKLQQYLCNINQSVNSVENLSVVAEETTSDVPAVKLESLPPTIEKNTETDVHMIDRGTTYVLPVEEESQTVYEKPSESKNKTISGKEEEHENDEDDRSSTYSFKSSNDFSETNEVADLTQNSSNHVTKGEVIKRIFSQIELLKQNVDPENLEKQEEEFKDDKMVKYDPKNPAKVLKTVFKGRKSSTELTIGLKDVPMTKVRNISVEKTKFSPNHTKISICISKENELDTTDKSDCKPLSNKVSSYYLDRMRPSLSMCQTEYTKGDDNGSKSSQSLNDRTEDEEDDFKSADSNVVDSDSSISSNPEKAKNGQAVVKISSPKSFNKHRFDFYRKMDMNVEGVRVRQKPPSSALGRFKELEPLRQALTELQIRMRSIKRDAILSSNDYYERALKLAKMSAGYCQSCGTRAVIPDDTFGYYKTLLPRRSAQRRSRHFKTTVTPNSSFYSFRSSNAEVSSQFCDLDITAGSSFSLNRTTHSNRTVLKSLLQDMPILYEKI